MRKFLMLSVLRTHFIEEDKSLAEDLLTKLLWDSNRVDTIDLKILDFRSYRAGRSGTCPVSSTLSSVKLCALICARFKFQRLVPGIFVESKKLHCWFHGGAICSGGPSGTCAARERHFISFEHGSSARTRACRCAVQTAK